MATIERKPLPPPNSAATKITEADRTEIIARANDVIEYYLNGPGSYFDSGTRKPLAGGLGDNTIEDLKNFKGHVIGSMQFADDPNSIMRSVVELIDQTIKQAEEAARNHEGRDSISLPPPNTNDPIDDPRVISSRTLSNAALPISLPVEGSQSAPLLQSGVTPSISSDKPVRILSRRIVDASQGPDSQDSFGDRFGSGASSESIPQRNPNFPVAPQVSKPLGIFSGKPMPDYPVPPPIWGLPDNSAASNSAESWFTDLLGAATSPRGASGTNGSSQMPELRKSQGSAPSNLPDYIQYLNQVGGQNPQASMFGPAAVADRIAALDPANPDRPAPRPGGLLGLILDSRR
jgi:hypothetical protein